MIQMTDVQIGLILTTIATAFGGMGTYIMRLSQNNQDAWRHVDKVTLTFNAVAEQNAKILEQNRELLDILRAMKENANIADKLKELSLTIKEMKAHGG